MFSFSANFEALTAKDVIQSAIDNFLFFTWKSLTNKNILRILEKHDCNIADFNWRLAK